MVEGLHGLPSPVGVLARHQGWIAIEQCSGVRILLVEVLAALVEQQVCCDQQELPGAGCECVVFTHWHIVSFESCQELFACEVAPKRSDGHPGLSATVIDREIYAALSAPDSSASLKRTCTTGSS